MEINKIYVCKKGQSLKKKIFTMDVEQDIDAALGFAKLLNNHKLIGEFYIVGILIDKWPKKVIQIQQLGHIIGGHGYKHENFSKVSHKRGENLIKKTIEICKKNNIKIQGWRFPFFKFRNSHLKILEKYGLFDSSMRDAVLMKWKQLMFIRNSLSTTLKNRTLSFPTFFPKCLEERPWTHTDCIDKFYKKPGRLVIHCYNFKKFKKELEDYLSIHFDSRGENAP